MNSSTSLATVSEHSYFRFDATDTLRRQPTSFLVANFPVEVAPNIGQSYSNSIATRAIDKNGNGVVATDTADGARIDIDALLRRAQLKNRKSLFKSSVVDRNVPVGLPTVPRQLIEDKAPTFRTLEQWVGTVTAVDPSLGIFAARVVSSTHDQDELAEFAIDEVSEDDHPLITEGAIFYWSVGYEIAVSRQRSTVSTIRFRRVHLWKRSNIEAALNRAESLTTWLSQV